MPKRSIVRPFQATSDPELLDVCRQEHRILLTLDLDFANIVDYPPAIRESLFSV